MEKGKRKLSGPKMASSESVSIKTVVQLRKETEQLEKAVNFLKMENFEYALKCNRIENVISNIESIIGTNPRKLVEASENLCEILKTCKAGQPILNKSHDMKEKSFVAAQSKSPDKSDNSILGCSKAHVVKPHMVNGTILYIPTINLTRLSDLQQQQQVTHSNSQCEADSSTLEGSPSVNSLTVAEITDPSEPSTSTAQELDDNQPTHLEEVSEASTSRSPAHSTVLSGTFQEVKIFLNQISQDSVQDESLNSLCKRSVRESKVQKRRSDHLTQHSSKKKRR